MAQANPGEQDPNTQAGTRSHQNPGGQQQAKPIEEKHLNDDATNRQEPSAHPKREPQHEPGFEAKHQKEAAKDDPNKRYKQGSQADEANARNQARDELAAHEDQKGQRAERAKLARPSSTGRPPSRRPRSASTSELRHSEPDPDAEPAGEPGEAQHCDGEQDPVMHVASVGERKANQRPAQDREGRRPLIRARG